MYWKLSIFSLVCAVSNVISQPTVTSPCPREDPTCLTELMRVLYKAVVSGHEPLDIPPSDPMDLELIEGNLPNLKYKLCKNTLCGFKECEIELVRITEDRNGTVFQLFCPNLKLTGDYTINGELIVMPIKGDGKFEINSDGYHFTVRADIKRSLGNMGRSYMCFDNFKIDADLRGGLHVRLTNLFDGDKELAEKTTNFIHDNWKQVADFAQMPIVEAIVTKLFTNLNKVVKTVPVDHLCDLEIETK